MSTCFRCSSHFFAAVHLLNWMQLKMTFAQHCLFSWWFSAMVWRKFWRRGKVGALSVVSDAMCSGGVCYGYLNMREICLVLHSSATLVPLGELICILCSDKGNSCIVMATLQHWCNPVLPPTPHRFLMFCSTDKGKCLFWHICILILQHLKELVIFVGAAH